MKFQILKTFLKKYLIFLILLLIQNDFVFQYEFLIHFRTQKDFPIAIPFIPEKVTTTFASYWIFFIGLL